MARTRAQEMKRLETIIGKLEAFQHDAEYCDKYILGDVKDTLLQELRRMDDRHKSRSNTIFKIKHGI